MAVKSVACILYFQMHNSQAASYLSYSLRKTAQRTIKNKAVIIAKERETSQFETPETKQKIDLLNQLKV